MSNIREFRNGDLPALVDVWVAHWSRCGPPPEVNVPIIEQAVLSRTFFDASTLLVALQDETVQAWCHFFPDPDDDQVATVSAICFTDTGLESTEPLLQAIESRIAELGLTRISVGVVRDQSFGYSGLPPMGHGIGVPSDDQATTSLLGRHGYTQQSIVQRMVVSANPYRMPVSRDVLQFRRSTSVVRQSVVPTDARRASALSHFDIERHTLVDQRSAAELASIALWISDPEAQVMKSSHAILDLPVIGQAEELLAPQRYLIGALLQSLAARRITSVETAIDSDRVGLIDQLSKLQFQSHQQGACWQKPC